MIVVITTTYRLCQFDLREFINNTAPRLPPFVRRCFISFCSKCIAIDHLSHYSFPGSLSRYHALNALACIRLLNLDPQFLTVPWRP
jgi:hypothetical protein